jgi:G3E family GTPase
MIWECDGQLVIDADEEIVEMNNGCSCCTVRGDHASSKVEEVLLVIQGHRPEALDRRHLVLGKSDPYNPKG